MYLSHDITTSLVVPGHVQLDANINTNFPKKLVKLNLRQYFHSG